MFTFPFLLVVNPELPVRSLKELVAYAKARPGQLNYGSPGVGTGGHLVTELLVKRTGIDAVHVPYQATTQQLLAAAAGTLQFTFDTVGNARGTGGGRQGHPARRHRGAAAPAPRPTCRRSRSSATRDSTTCSSPTVCWRLPAPRRPMIKALNREMVRMNASGPIREKLMQASYEPGTHVAGGIRRDDRSRAQALGRRGAGDRRAREGLIGQRRKRMPQ